jgi:hypothetical protein
LWAFVACGRCMQTSLGYSGFARFKPLLGFLALIRRQLGFAAKTNADSQGALGAYDPLCTRPDERTLKLGQGGAPRTVSISLLCGVVVSANAYPPTT